MKTIVITLAFLILLPSLSLAAPDIDDMLTLCPVGVTEKGGNVVGIKLYNGRFWKHLNTNDNKAMFIAGLMDGATAYFIVSGVGTLPKQQAKYIDIHQSFMSSGFSPPEIANIIDDIYRDNSNIRIPIYEIHRVALEKGTGATQEKIERTLSELRKKFNK